MAAGFMAGFGNTMSKLIEDDREYYRELATKKRDYLQTYGTKAILDRDEKANGAVSLFNTLVTAGIPQDDLRYVLDTTGVSGLAELKSTLSTRDDLTPAQIKGLVEKSKDYVAKNPNEDITEVMRRAYGLYKSSDNPVEQETNMFAAVLGLDSRMMERDVLNDVYIDGFKGYELETIMARGGPKPGEALSLNLPTKPASERSRSQAGQTMLDLFDRSIDGKIEAQRRLLTDPAKATAARKEMDRLEKIKAQGSAGLYDYAIKDDPALLNAAKILETDSPGIITRNSLALPGFSTQFASWYGDQQDDATLNSKSSGGQEPGGPIDTPKAYSQDSIKAAIDKGDINVGDTIIVDGQQIVVRQGFIDTYTKVAGLGMDTGEGLSLEKDGGSLLPPVEEEASSTSLPDRSAMEAKLQQWMSYLTTPSAEAPVTTPSAEAPVTTPSDGDAVPETSSTDNELDLTDGGTQIKSFVPFAIGMIPTDSYTEGEDAYDLSSGLRSLAMKYYDFNREEIEEWFKIYTEGGDLKLNQGKEKSFYDGIYKAYSELQEARTIKKALARSDATDDRLAMQRRETALNDFDLPVPPEDLSLIDTLSVNTEEDLKAAITKRIGEMPPDYKVQVADTLASLNEVLKAFETSANISIENAIDAVTVDNIDEAVNNMAVRMFDTIADYDYETLEERIINQNEVPSASANRAAALSGNRAAAFAKLQQQFSELAFFPKGVPGKIDLGPTMGEVWSDWLHSKQDNINSAIASAAKSFLAKIGIGKPSADSEFNDAVKAEAQPEPLVTRPKRTKKPKQMTASDKARLKRAQKANELSGDSSLLKMLVEKYGSAIVQKEMGL